MKPVDFVRDLADHLGLGTPLPWEDCVGRMEAIRDLMDEMYAGYEDAPEGGERLAAVMREALDLFDSAFHRLTDYPRSGNFEDLARAVYEAETADDLLALAEEVIAEEQREEADHQVA